MIAKPETQVNLYGDEWEIEREESDRLSKLDGFLMTYKNVGRITLNAKLPLRKKAEGYSILTQRLCKIPVGSSSVQLWNVADVE